MRPSPVIHATAEATASLHTAAARWGQLFGSDALRAQIEADAEAVAQVFEGFQAAYGALPRFRTEPALRRFTETMQQLTRALRAARLAGAAGLLEEAASAAAQGAEQAESALAALTGKTLETPEAPKPMRGSVQRLLGDRGYGFVRADGSMTDLFFNSQSVQGVQFSALRVSQAVSFRIVPDPRVPGRMQAIEVQVLR